MSTITFGELPYILWADVDLARPHERAVPHKHLVEELLVPQAFPVRLVQVPRAVKDGSVAGVELDINPVAVQRSRGHYVVYDLHSTFQPFNL